MNAYDILLIFPQLGRFDSLFRDIPLSLIYAATDSVKHGYTVKIFDCRLYTDNWKEQLDTHLKKGCSLVGLSVMTGHPIMTSLEISQYVKENYGYPIVWGGAHPTILPEQTLKNDYIDYVIRDGGSLPLYQLISSLSGKPVKLDDIPGLGYKKDSRIILTPPSCSFELLDYRDIPYHLVDIDSEKYGRFRDTFVFPIFTAFGCPYKCAFCQAPTVYQKIKGKKWIVYPVDSVIDHIAFLLKRYKINKLQVTDDVSFVDQKRIKEFLTKYIEKGFHKNVTLDFRGVRIDQLDRLDESILKLMVTAKTEILGIGAESGSDEVLIKMKKGITVEQIIRVNKKLSKYPSLRPHFNIFCGIPGETYEDLIKTKNLMLTLVKDNPNSLIGFASDFKALPGTELTEIAIKDYNLKLPESIEEWAELDSFEAEKVKHPWYTTKIDNYIKLLQLMNLFFGQTSKIVYREMDSGRLTLFKILELIANMDKPFLKLRLKYNFSSFLFEHSIRNVIMKYASRIKR